VNIFQDYFCVFGRSVRKEQKSREKVRIDYMAQKDWVHTANPLMNITLTLPTTPMKSTDVGEEDSEASLIVTSSDEDSSSSSEDEETEDHDEGKKAVTFDNSNQVRDILNNPSESIDEKNPETTENRGINIYLSLSCILYFY